MGQGPSAGIVRCCDRDNLGRRIAEEGKAEGDGSHPIKQDTLDSIGPFMGSSLGRKVEGDGSLMAESSGTSKGSSIASSTAVASPIGVSCDMPLTEEPARVAAQVKSMLSANVRAAARARQQGQKLQQQQQQQEHAQSEEQEREKEQEDVAMAAAATAPFARGRSEDGADEQGTRCPSRRPSYRVCEDGDEERENECLSSRPSYRAGEDGDEERENECLSSRPSYRAGEDDDEEHENHPRSMQSSRSKLSFRVDEDHEQEEVLPPQVFNTYSDSRRSHHSELTLDEETISSETAATCLPSKDAAFLSPREAILAFKREEAKRKAGLSPAAKKGAHRRSSSIDPVFLEKRDSQRGGSIRRSGSGVFRPRLSTKSDDSALSGDEIRAIIEIQDSGFIDAEYMKSVLNTPNSKQEGRLSNARAQLSSNSSLKNSGGQERTASKGSKGSRLRHTAASPFTFIKNKLKREPLENLSPRDTLPKEFRQALINSMVSTNEDGTTRCMTGSEMQTCLKVNNHVEVLSAQSDVIGERQSSLRKISLHDCG